MFSGRFESPILGVATGFTLVEYGFCTTSLGSLSYWCVFQLKRAVVQKPANHRDKPGGQQNHRQTAASPLSKFLINFNSSIQ